MNEKELNIELDKIHENQEGDEIYIPNSLVEKIFERMIKKETKKYSK